MTDFPIHKIYLSESNPQLNKAIVIDGDEQSVWGYCLDTMDGQQKLLFDGFICSRGIVVDGSDQVKESIQNGNQPPLMKAYQNEYSIHERLMDSDFSITWNLDKGIVEVALKNEPYLIMDYKNQVSYSKSIVSEGPYGIPINKYLSE